MSYRTLVHRLRGRLYRFLRRPALAIHEYHEALAADPALISVKLSLAHLLALHHRDQEAIAHYRAALVQAPDNASAWFNLGFLHERQHDVLAAIQAFRQATQLNPKLDLAWYGLGRCHAGRGENAHAAEAFERAAQLQPMNGVAWYEWGLVQHRLGHADKVKEIAAYLNRFDRHHTRRLIEETARADLAYLIEDLKR